MIVNAQKIIAIGGGEIGRPKEDGKGFYPVETTPIDAEILRLTNKKAATLLFIPTASNDSRDYFEVVRKHFLKVGFASVDVIYLLDSTLTTAQIKEAILSHDAIYVGGGNTLRMMTAWRRLGVGMMLKQALHKGIVLSGVSAGSNCWFTKGISDLKSTTSTKDKLMNVTGLGFIDAVLCPHYDAEPYRQSDIKSKMMRSAKVAVCLDNCTALEVFGSEYRIIKSKATAQARRVYWKDGKYYDEILDVSDEFKSIDSLLTK